MRSAGVPGDGGGGEGKVWGCGNVGEERQGEAEKEGGEEGGEWVSARRGRFLGRRVTFWGRASCIF